jgi:hypothetical protein
MANLFDTKSYPLTEPRSFSVGDRVAWKRTNLTDYSPTLYTLSYFARKDGSGTDAFSATATANGTEFVVEISSSISANLIAGTYRWSSFLTRNADSERIEMGSGVFTLHPDKASSTDDPRNHTKKVLDAIEAVIEGRAGKDQESLSVEGMTLQRTPLSDLIALHSKYKGIYVRETRAQRMRDGLSHSGKIYTRF